ncbi:MAG: Rpn family recombination-promoting nuclease/putative transposase [Armatimonadetes bacterium]|nr:Rpn family recombination-promoting nuclease/putative transposase [Armatimonadota bacterium]
MAAREIADSLEFSRAERVNRSFVPASLHKHEADLLYRVPHRSGSSEVWVFLLVEHQSRPDRLMGHRLLSYMVQVWDLQRQRWEQEKTPSQARRLSPIIPLVFYTGRRRWSGVPGLAAAMDGPAALQRFVPRFESLFVSLSGIPDEALTGSPLGCVLRALQAADGGPEELETALVAAIQGLEALPPEAQAEWSRAVHYLLLLVRHTCQPHERSEL